MISRYRPGNRLESISSMSCRKAFKLLSRTSLRTRWIVSTSSSTMSRPAWPESRSTLSNPWRKLRAQKWSMSPFTPANRLAAAATLGCPASHAAMPSAVAVSPLAHTNKNVPTGSKRPEMCPHACGAGARGRPIMQLKPVRGDQTSHSLPRDPPPEAPQPILWLRTTRIADGEGEGQE